MEGGGSNEELTLNLPFGILQQQAAGGLGTLSNGFGAPPIRQCPGGINQACYRGWRATPNLRSELQACDDQSMEPYAATATDQLANIPDRLRWAAGLASAELRRCGAIDSAGRAGQGCGNGRPDRQLAFLDRSWAAEPPGRCIWRTIPSSMLRIAEPLAIQPAVDTKPLPEPICRTPIRNTMRCRRFCRSA